MKQAICNLFRGTKYYVVVRGFFGFPVPKKRAEGQKSPWGRSVTLSKSDIYDYMF